MAEEGKISIKVWGKEEYITNTPDYCGKVLYVNPGYVCSLHRHLQKKETFGVVFGSGIIRAGTVLHRVEAGSVIHISQKAWHRFATAKGMTLIEISTNHSELDVERRDESHKITQDTDPDLWELLYR